jgi:peptidoglycan/LPS O-acetylase OafA/YrhL
MAGKGRMHALDGLRGIAAVAVVALHVWMYTDGHRGGQPLWLYGVIGEFRVAVVLFFVLSGFLLARPWIAAARGEREPPRVGRYALRRFARIAPGYWLALAGSLLLIHRSGHGRDISLWSVPKFAAFLPNVFPDTRNMLDPPMWSLSVEVMFYAALPLVGLALIRAGRGRHGPLVVCAALAAASLAWNATGLLRGWPPEVTWTLPTFLGSFACGIAAAQLAYGARPGVWTTRLVLAAGVAIAIANSWWHRGNTGSAAHILGDLPGAVGFAAVVWAVALRPAGWLGSAPLRAVGTLSYGVYLWHMPLMYALQVHGEFPLHFLPALARVLPLTFALATLSWFAVERPALRLSARALTMRARGREPLPATG